MQAGDALNMVAQVAVTLAGFAGIVMVFRPDSIHQWSALDRFRLRLLLANSALPLVYALFAIFLLSIVPPPVSIWRWCSGVTLALDLVFMILSRGPVPSIPPAEFNLASKTLYYSVITLASIGLLLQVINVFVWNFFWPFLASLLIHLIAAVAQFVRMILLAPGRS